MNHRYIILMDRVLQHSPKLILASILLLCSAVLFAQPTIKTFSPTSGHIGTTVTITGTNFHVVPDSNLVRFGTAKATVVAAATTSLIVTVPLGATSQSITVTTDSLTAFSIVPFEVKFAGGGFVLPGSFATQLNFASGIGAYYTGSDFDGDGREDLAIGDYYDYIRVWRNIGSAGNISFASPRPFTTGNGCRGIFAGDLDGDGKPDVITANQAGGSASVSILRNTSVTGNVSFAAKIDRPTGTTAYSSPENVLIRDLNNDGKPDIVIVHSDNVITVYKNLSTPGLIRVGAKQNFSIGRGAESICVADIDSDGMHDLITANSSVNYISVLRNTTSLTGEIAFAPAQNFPTDSGPVAIAAGDLDGDGRPDIATANLNAHNLSLLKNTSTPGNPSFSSQISYKTELSPRAVAINDMDGDGRPDLITANTYIASTVSIFRNKGSVGEIMLDTKVSYDIAGAVAGIRIGDFDKDSLPDIAAGYSILRNRTSAAQITSFTPTFGGPGSLITITGFNFSEATDVRLGAVTASSFSIVSPTTVVAVVGGGATGNVQVTAPAGNGLSAGFTYYDKPFITSFTPLSGSVGTTVTITGANFGETPADNIVYFGSARAIVSASTINTLTVVVPPGADCKPLTVTTNHLTAYSSQSFLVTFPGAPATILPGSFATRQEIFGTSHPVGISAGDIDGDGRLDLVASNSSGNTLTAFRNTSSSGLLSFDAALSFPGPNTSGGMSLSDFDGDGKLDVLANTSTSVSVFRNTSVSGSISFAPGVDFSIGGSTVYSGIGDVNLDGKPDIVVVRNGYMGLLQNISAVGTISFELQTIGTSLDYPRGVAISDLNDDRRPEIIVCIPSDDRIYIFPNNSLNGTVSLGAVLEYDANDGPIQGLSVTDIDGDQKPDVVVAGANSSGIAVFKNTSAGSISLASFLPFSTHESPNQLLPGDIDGDSRPDLVAAHGIGSVLSVLKNRSAGNIDFAPALDFVSDNGLHSVALADLDGDGKPEMVSVNRIANNISIFRNKINEPILVPSGSNPVTGPVIHKLTIDPSVQTYNGKAYVQRHYDVEPLNNPSTATATITLFFTQEEFNNLNAHPSHGQDLPKGPSDVDGKANLRVLQQHGFSITSLPGSYDGDGHEINPDDEKIIWNPLAQWWEVTFDVNGFSGFFVTSVAASLPLKLLSFEAKGKGSTALIKWTSSNEIDVAYFDLQKSTNGRDFNSITRIPATNNDMTNRYQYTDGLGREPIYYYRLKMTDHDRTTTYSNIIRVNSASENFSLVAYPNPTREYVIVEHPATAGRAHVKLIDIVGRVVKTIRVNNNVLQTTVSLKEVPVGSYQISWSDGIRLLTKTVIVE